MVSRKIKALLFVPLKFFEAQVDQQYCRMLCVDYLFYSGFIQAAV
jgi:hypothetical protein